MIRGIISIPNIPHQQSERSSTESENTIGREEQKRCVQHTMRMRKVFVHGRDGQEVENKEEGTHGQCECTIDKPGAFSSEQPKILRLLFQKS